METEMDSFLSTMATRSQTHIITYRLHGIGVQAPRARSKCSDFCYLDTNSISFVFDYQKVPIVGRWTLLLDSDFRQSPDPSGGYRISALGSYEMEIVLQAFIDRTAEREGVGADSAAYRYICLLHLTGLHLFGCQVISPYGFHPRESVERARIRKPHREFIGFAWS